MTTAIVLTQKRVFISGWVQGVGFRAATVAQAKRHPTVKGYVRNLLDGRVEAVFAGPVSDVEALVTWCKSGPPHSSVTDISVTEESADPALTEFSVQRDR